MTKHAANLKRGFKNFDTLRFKSWTNLTILKKNWYIVLLGRDLVKVQQYGCQCLTSLLLCNKKNNWKRQRVWTVSICSLDQKKKQTQAISIPQSFMCLLSYRQKKKKAKGLCPFSIIRHGYAGKKQSQGWRKLWTFQRDLWFIHAFSIDSWHCLLLEINQ